MVHLFSYLANFIWNLSGTLEEETPYPSSKFAKSLRGKLIALGTFILRPVLMQHTVPQRPNVDLGKIWLHRSKPEKIQQHLLFTVFFWGVPYVHFGHLPIGNQWRLKRFYFKKWVSSTQDQPQFNHLLPIPEKRSHPKCLDKQLLDGENSGKRGGHWDDVPDGCAENATDFSAFQASENWLDRFLWQAKWRTPQKTAFSGIVAF